jgi:hypothetical protein
MRKPLTFITPLFSCVVLFAQNHTITWHVTDAQERAVCLMNI